MAAVTSLLIEVVAVAERCWGVVDGSPPVGVESDEDIVERRGLLRIIGFKL